ncbi:MAG: hypothetical protein HYT49_02575 [Candidatus Wildermuthbacteria bacterium]|nr:hypothetical protein [Candidatus Wildermuthbacteria bacterium]
MNNEEIKKLALALIQAETEKTVVEILSKSGLWSDKKVWKEVDESSGNWSTIGNQQSAPDTALVEKIINSVDAMLMKECLSRGIEPTSQEAPKSIAEAQKEYFGIYDGKLSSIDASARSNLAENIFLVASGSKASPSYSLVDLGEGQSPERFLDTFLSLNRGNKSKIQFVQGKFGMGGTGVFRFGSPEHNLQLIVSRRNREIKNKTEKDLWGMTIIRRIPPTGQMRSSVFTYLAPAGEILSFTSKTLPLLPNDDLDAYKKSIEHGTFIKIYDYQMSTGRLRSDATRHLHNRLSLLMPEIALPIKVADTRFRKSPIKTLSGLSVRLDEDKRENLEDGFPGSGEMTVQGQRMDYSIYAFKVGKRETYATEEGIIFIVNGQTHGSLPRYFFERKVVGMNYLSDSILVIVDCSRIDRRMQEDLFMNSRDRLGGGPLQSEIERKMEDIIKNHPGLRELREKRKRELVEHKLQDSKPLADVLENIIKKSPSLSSLFMQGVRIKNPFKLTGAGEQEKFKGKTFPSYFKLSKQHPSKEPKHCPINRRFRIQYETDAENDYFKRDKDPGELTLEIDESPIEDYSLNLWNGLATLTIGIPQQSEIGNKLCFRTGVIDISRIDSFSSEFCIEVDKPQQETNGGHGKRKKPSGKDTGKDREKPIYLDIPHAYEVRRNEWEKHKFDEKSALKVVDGGEEAGYDFYINMDNVYLQMEIKENSKIEPKLLEARFKYGMVLLGISLLDFDNKSKKLKGEAPEKNNDVSIYEKIAMFSRAISPTLLPMIVSLSDLEVEP